MSRWATKISRHLYQIRGLDGHVVISSVTQSLGCIGTRTCDEARALDAPHRDDTYTTLNSEEEESHGEVPTRHNVLLDRFLCITTCPINDSKGFLTLLTTVIMILAAQYAAIGRTTPRGRNQQTPSSHHKNLIGSSVTSPGSPVAIGPVSAFATSLARSPPRGAIISPCRSSSLSVGGVCAREAIGVGAKGLLLDMLRVGQRPESI